MELPANVLVELKDRLMAGQTPLEIATWLQASGYQKSLKLDTLEKAVQRYRTGDLKQELLKKAVAMATRIPSGAIIKKVVVMDELASLIEKQRLRLDAVMKKEKLDAGLLLGMVSNEMDRMRSLLESMAKLQLETGALARAPKMGAGILMPPGVDNVDDPGVVKIMWQEGLGERFQKVLDNDIKQFN